MTVALGMLARSATAGPALVLLDPALSFTVFPSALSPAGSLVTGVRSPVSDLGEGVRWTRESGWTESPGAGVTELVFGNEYFIHQDLSRTNELLYTQLDPAQGDNGFALRRAPDGTEPSSVVPMPAGCSLAPTFSDAAAAISADGTGIAARATCGVVRWDAAINSSAVIGGASVGPLAISDDGDAIAGTTASGPFLWTLAGGAQSLNIQLGTVSSLSGDGTAVAGTARVSGLDSAFVWDALHGTTFLAPQLAGQQSVAAISFDGGVAVGNSGADAAQRAFVWTRDGGAVALAQRSIVSAMTPDGRWATGRFVAANGMSTAFLWDLEAGTARTLESVLSELGVAVPAGGLVGAGAISDDGTTILGTSFSGPFVATIPEPATALLVAGGIAWLSSRSTRRARTG